MKTINASNHWVKICLAQNWAPSELKRQLQAGALAWDTQGENDTDPFLKALAKAFLGPGAESRAFRLLNVFAKEQRFSWLPGTPLCDQPAVWLFLGLSSTLNSSLNTSLPRVLAQLFPKDLSDSDRARRWQGLRELAQEWSLDFSRSSPVVQTALPRNLVGTGSAFAFWTQWLRFSLSLPGATPPDPLQGAWQKALGDNTEVQRLCVDTFKALKQNAEHRERMGQAFNDGFVPVFAMFDQSFGSGKNEFTRAWSEELESLLLGWVRDDGPWSACTNALATWLLWEHASPDFQEVHGDLLGSALDRSVEQHLNYYATANSPNLAPASGAGLLAKALLVLGAQSSFPQALDHHQEWSTRKHAQALDEHWPAPSEARPRSRF